MKSSVAAACFVTLCVSCGMGTGPTMSAPAVDMRYRVSLSIDQIRPSAPWEGQEVVVTYTLHNGGLEPAGGRIAGSFGVRALEAAVLPSQVGIAADGIYGERAQGIPSGREATGTFRIRNAPSGTFKVELTYVDQVTCTSVPWNNGTQREICKAGVLARDQLDVTVIPSSQILTSPDRASYVAMDQTSTAALCRNKTYPWDMPSFSAGAPNEWEDIPGNTDVPFVGRLINTNKPPLNDLVWDHPFGFDFWFNSAPDPEYFGFLTDLAIASRSDCSAAGIAAKRGEGDACNSFALEERNGRIPTGALHTEIEDRLLPADYRPEADDRVYMRGRRIVDCGHDNYTAEMHPPLFVASARIDSSSGAVRSKLYTMPYRTLQTYDTFGRTFLDELGLSLGGLLTSFATSPLVFSAKVTNVPFDAKVIASYRVTMPSLEGLGTPRLIYSFRVRPGVKVTVTQASTHDADVVVTLDTATYRGPPDPICSQVTYSLIDAEKQIGLPFGTLHAGLLAVAHLPIFPPNVETSLATGLRIKSCTIPGPAPLPPGATANNAVIEDAAQASPVYGWLDWEVDASLVTVHVDRAGLGRVTARGIDCGSTCDASYPKGSLVTLAANPDPGWKFDGWSGACGAQTTASCTTTVAAPFTTAGVRFAPQAAATHRLTIDLISDPQCSASGSGTVTAGSFVVCRSFGPRTSCSASVPDGTSVTLSAAATTGSKFASYSGACSGTTCALTIRGPTSVTASFCGLVR